MDEEVNIEEKSSDELWKEIGFVRPLGGLLYNIFLVFGAAGIGIAFSVWLIPKVIYPFPAAIGWEGMTKDLFSFYFTMADIGIGIAIERFIGELNIKEPKKTIHYIQFFIYFQMFTGLIQITIIAIWVFSSLGSGLSYAAWFFLLYSTIQWPGMLGIFTGSLRAYQRFDRANVVGFVQAIVLENTTRIICILLGRYLGTMNPAIGELMGATIGSIVGAYIDDFLAAILGAHWLKPILKDIDPTWKIWDVFRVDFDKEVSKKCLSFGVRTMIPKVIFPFANMISVVLLTEHLPSYSSVWGLYILADMIGGISGSFIFDFTSSFAEAYQNGKIRLSQDYILRAYRWTGLLGFFIIGILFPMAPLLGIIMGEQYASAVPMMRAIMLFKLMEAIIKYHDRIFQGAGKPEYNIISLGVEQAMRILLLYIFLVPIPIGGMSIVLSRGLGWIIKWFVSAALIQKTVMKLKINFWQTLVAPIISTILETLFLQLLITLLLVPLSLVVPEIVAILIIMILGLFLGSFLVWFPSYGFFGGWDDGALAILDKAKKISGPSKGFISLIQKFSYLGIKISPFHNKFATDTEGIEKEIQELVQLRELSLKNQGI